MQVYKMRVYKMLNVQNVIIWKVSARKVSDVSWAIISHCLPMLKFLHSHFVLNVCGLWHISWGLYTIISSYLTQVTLYGCGWVMHHGAIISRHHQHTVTLGNQGIYCFQEMVWLFNFPGKPLKLFPSNFTRLTFVYGKFFCWPCWCSWMKITLPLKHQRSYLVPTQGRRPLIQSLQNLVALSP